MYSYVEYTTQLSAADSDYQCKIDDGDLRFTTHVSTWSVMLSVNTRHLKRIRLRDLTSHGSDEMDILVTTLKLYDIRFGIVESICKEDFKIERL